MCYGKMMEVHNILYLHTSTERGGALHSTVYLKSTLWTVVMFQTEFTREELQWKM